ncbi:AAA family ATPase [Verrucomicrobiota bacterium sgz303538]
MNITLPIYVEERSRGTGDAPLFLVRPLHHPEPLRKAEKLSRALTQLQSALQVLLKDLSRDPRHDELARWCLPPDYDITTLDLRIELKSGSHSGRFFLAGYEALGRKLWFTPKLPDLHFEVLREQRLADRALEVFTDYFREMERKGEPVDFDDYALPQHGKASFTVLDVKVKLELNALKARPTKGISIFGGGDPKPDGETELRNVGRLLNSLYPDDLPRALGRDAEVANLERWLRLPDKRAILLVGPRQVGKTAIVQELLWRMMEDKVWTRRRNIWLVSPMRLISGMSYVGQWENRVQAIFDHIERSDSVLYLDDLPGAFTAGQSANSDMNVAQLLKPRLEKRSMRLLAEVTPETWRVLRERDRTLAEMFHVLPVAEPMEADTLRILVGVARETERQHHCEFTLDVVPTAYELYRRFASYAAFPGKAAGFLQRLAVKHTGESCNRASALQEFHERSGLQLSMLDDTRALDRESIVKELQKLVAGQDEVLHAFADVLITLKARLNDRKRPLAVFLLLGPTGVGKTQCAKALARHLFGSAERLLRFDTNEMVDASAVLRLTGTPAEPDGLLTGAVRRQPFSVILFDEIEKAAPEIFDMLLGVLDEGRLSDALGRVADFTSSVILLTSNLGAREAGERISFTAVQREDRDAAYVAAAEKFFRPEFFNRLDRVLPFRELQREHLAAITQRLLAELLQRDGLRQRQCMFDFTPAAAERLVELGHHPQLGARALKRTIEREVAQPLAAELATRTPGFPLQIELRCDGERFSLHTRELRPVERTVFWPERLAQGDIVPKSVLDAAYAALDRLREVVQSRAPAGKVDLSALTPAQESYYHCREQIERVKDLLDAAEASLNAKPGSPTRAMAVSRTRSVRAIMRYSEDPGHAYAREAERFQAELADVEAAEHELIETPLYAVARDVALLEQMAAEPFTNEAGGLVIRGHGSPAYDCAVTLRRRLQQFLNDHWGTEASPVQDEAEPVGPFRLALWTVGLNVTRLLEPVLGSWLLNDKEGTLHTLEVSLVPCSVPKELLQLVAHSPANLDSALVMTVRRDGQIISHRTGLILPREPEGDEYRAFHLAGLPVPEELAGVL